MRTLIHTLATALLLTPLVILAPAQAATFKIATLAPDGTAWMKEMRAGADEIAKRTGGRVEFKFYPGGVMGNDKSVLRKIRIRQLQGGALTSGALVGDYPDAQIYSLPLIFRNHEEVAYVRQHMDPLLKQGLEKAGFVALGISDGGFAYLMSNHPIHAIEELQNQKVWVPEGDVISEAVFKAGGIAPVSLSMADVYTGLQTGLIDTIAATPTAAIAFQWHTKMSYITDTPLVFVIGLMLVDKNAFDRLSPADQAVMREVIGGVFKRLDSINREDDAKALVALKNQGIQTVTPSGEEQAKWQALADTAIKSLAASGAYSQPMLDTLRAHLRDSRAQHPQQPQAAP